jgi:hypothetical protein
MNGQRDEALEVLRGIWNARGQTAADLEAADDTAKTCKKMADVGFDGLADGDPDLRSAWRAKLRREGKLNPEAGSVADLVLGPARDR